MQSICHLSRRWHQQFCRSPSFLGHRQCLQRWQARTYRRPPDVVVREYEQIEGKPSTRRAEQDPGEADALAIRNQIKKLERELAIMRQGPFSRNSEFMQQLPADEREELLKGMEEEGLDDDFDLPEIDFEEPMKEEPLAVTLRVPAKHRAYVKRFNTALKTTDQKSKRTLWVWYLRCQQKVPGFSTFISEDVWDHLWQTQVELHPRSRHIVMLGKDMEAAGIPLEERLADYLDALHHTGETSTALQIWEKEQGPAMIGVRLYAAIGRPSKAEEIALSNLEPDTILPVIKAWAESKKSNAATRLWSFYQMITPSTDVLGQITSILLKAGRQDMALAVFRDMIGKGQTIQGKDINEFGLKALLTLPHKFKNKFFFGAWIKWLLGEGKVEDATLVVELMQEQGVKPDARHLNGIIGAWLREGSAAGRTSAEQIAWGMIQERIRQVKLRGRHLTIEEHQLLQDHELEHRLPRFLQRNMPAASIETFSILLQRYTRQSDAAKAEELTTIMTGPAQIKPNSFILNHWLYLSLRSSDLGGMWSRFKEAQIQPDLETFACLWDGQRRNLSQPQPSSYPTPRQLYKEMITWLTSLSESKLTEAREQFTPQLYEQITRCFCLHSDLPCTFLALRHMHDNFNTLPHEDIASMVVMQVARMMPHSTGLAARPRRTARRRSDEMYRAALSNLTDLLNEIFLENMTRAEESGIEVNMTGAREGPVAQSLRLESLQSFLCLVMMRQAKEGSHVDNDIVLAGRALGVAVEQEMVRKWLDDAVNMYEDGK